MTTPARRNLLRYAALAALAAGALGAAGSALEAARGEATGFSLGTALMLLALAPQVVVLLGFLRVADAAGDPVRDPLRRSSVCTFGTLFLAAGFATLADLLGADGQALFGISLVAGLGLAGLLAYAFRGGGGLAFLVVAYLLAKYGVGYLVTGRRLDPGDALPLAVLLLLAGSAIGYPVWFAVTLWRARDRFGPPAAGLAGVVLLTVAVFVGLGSWFVVALATAPKFGPMDEKAIDDLFAPHFLRFAVAAAVGEVATGVATAVFFLGAARRVGSPSP